MLVTISKLTIELFDSETHMVFPLSFFPLRRQTIATIRAAIRASTTSKSRIFKARDILAKVPADCSFSSFTAAAGGAALVVVE